MAKESIGQDLAPEQVRLAARIAREWGQDAANRYIANERRKNAWLARHGYAEVQRSHVCFRWLAHRRCLGWRCETVGSGGTLEHASPMQDRNGERLIICAPYPDRFSKDVVAAVCERWGLRADIRETDTYYGAGTVHVEFRVA